MRPISTAGPGWFLFNAAKTLFQGRCQACGRPLAAVPEAADALPLCPGCMDDIGPGIATICPSCGIPLPDQAAAHSVCPECAANPNPWGRLTFYGLYEGLLRELILSFKFNSGLGLSSLLQRLAVSAYEAWEQSPDHVRPDMIVPIPLHPSRLRQRGYNQSPELARGLAREKNIPIPLSALVRTRGGTAQARLAEKERLENIRGAFKADPTQVKSARVLVVDDILTTGATLREAASTLIAAGAEAVDVLVLARTE